MHHGSELNQSQGKLGYVIRMLQRDVVVRQIKDIRDDDEFAHVDEWMARENFPHCHVVCRLGLGAFILDVVCRSW